MSRRSSHAVYVAERAARRAAARVQERNVAYYAANPDEIETRLAELDAEMDVERAMDVYALRAAAIGGALSLFRSRNWILVPLAAALTLGVQAAAGDSALRLLMRKMGYRTAQEITAEEDALMDLLSGPPPRDASPDPLGPELTPKTPADEAAPLVERPVTPGASLI